MKKYYWIFICGFLGLFLIATATFAVAAPEGRKTTEKRFSFQEKKSQAEKKRQTEKKSLIRPSIRRDYTPQKNYRQNTARNALKSGRIVSLAVIRKRVRQSFPGKIVDVRLLEPKRNNKPYTYMVKVLRKDGKLLELKINAKNAKIVAVKGNK